MRNQTLAGSPRLTVEGVHFDSLTESEVVSTITLHAAAGRGGWVVTPNVDILYKVRRDPSLAELIDHAEIVVADGMPIIWASALLRHRLPARVAGSELVWSVSRGAATAGLSVFLFGGVGDTPTRAAALLTQELPSLRVVGAFAPPLNFDPATADLAPVEALLQQHRPNIVFVGLGFPKQERVIRRLQALHPNVWFLGIGAGIDMAAGKVSRAPRAFQVLGLEWVYRLVQEPQRLARRYLANDIPFALGMLRRAALARRDSAWRTPAPTPPGAQQGEVPNYAWASGAEYEGEQRDTISLVSAEDAESGVEHHASEEKAASRS